MDLVAGDRSQPLFDQGFIDMIRGTDLHLAGRLLLILFELALIKVSCDLLG